MNIVTLATNGAAEKLVASSTTWIPEREPIYMISMKTRWLKLSTVSMADSGGCAAMFSVLNCSISSPSRGASSPIVCTRFVRKRCRFDSAEQPAIKWSGDPQFQHFLWKRFALVRGARQSARLRPRADGRTLGGMNHVLKGMEGSVLPARAGQCFTTSRKKTAYCPPYMMLNPSTPSSRSCIMHSRRALINC